MNNQQTSPPPHVVLSFVGPIQYPATKNLRNACCQAVNSGASILTLLISSPGGSTVEGFALYHFLRSLPVELTTHNIGSIESIANIVFISGVKRFACSNTRFMYHDLTWTYGQQETLDRDQMRQRAESLDADAHQFIEIFKSHTSLTDEDFKTLQLLQQPNLIRPDRAKEIGIIQEITDAKIAAGIPFWNVDF
jgi:ATP-dependent protease ClpP protease subunit